MKKRKKAVATKEVVAFRDVTHLKKFGDKLVTGYTIHEVCVCVFVCIVRDGKLMNLCVCVCVRETESETEKERKREGKTDRQIKSEKKGDR